MAGSIEPAVVAAVDGSPAALNAAVGDARGVAAASARSGSGSQALLHHCPCPVAAVR
ncbi:hypothetical protein ACFWQL_16945 [Amycolatopsis thermoflava]|uniref:hypothetical protein n=1 Tax=Amycolatopsis TaxID=1813 RepID=UPI003666C0E7